jgi:hypothetical protein
VLVQRRDQLADLLARHRLAVLALDLGLHRGDVVHAVEQREDLDHTHGQQDDRWRVPGRIAHRQVALPVLLDREHVDAAQAWKWSAHRLRKFRDDAT